MWPNPWQGDYWRACVNAFPNLGVVVLKSPMALCVPDEELNWIQEWSTSTNLQRIYINHGFDESLDIGSIDLISVRTVFFQGERKVVRHGLEEFCPTFWAASLYSIHEGGRQGRF